MNSSFDNLHKITDEKGRHQSEITEEDIDEISALFYGKEVEIKTYFNAETNSNETHKSNESFYNILLNVQTDGDIYHAWEKDHRDTIDDYEHTAG